MRITSIRRGRIIRIAACIFIFVPLLYLLITWSDGPKKAKEVFQAKFAPQKPKERPKLIKGT